MLGRFFSRLVIVLSIVTLSGVTYYFMDEYRTLRERERMLRAIAALDAEQGPCVALAELRRLANVANGELRSRLSPLRLRLVEAVVGTDDKRGRRALLAAVREGLVDEPLCEQIRLAREAGEMHPVLALLRYTRGDGGRPCDDEAHLGAVLDGLGSHRPAMLHAVLRDVAQLGCLSPALAAKVATMALAALVESPYLFDDLDVLQVASFLEEWAPLQAAQLACSAAARGEPSAVANAIGCSPEVRRDVLVHYRALREVPATSVAPSVAVGTEWVLLEESGPFCGVAPATGSLFARTVPCRSLGLSSDLVLAVRIEALSYGRTAADLIAGLAAYVGKTGEIVRAVDEPKLRSWYAYGPNAAPLGSAARVELGAVAAMLGETVPDAPLRSFCRGRGAKHCYDVDWAHVVSHLPGEPVVFLSRPARVFLAPVPLSPEDSIARSYEVFGRAPRADGVLRVFTFGASGELLVESGPAGLELGWRPEPQGAWRRQSLEDDPGAAKTVSARLLAGLDVQQDGWPELVIERRVEAAATAARTGRDEILLLHLPRGGVQFAVLNRLTIHEF